MIKNKGSIFSSLVMSYILFSILLIVAFAVSVLAGSTMLLRGTSLESLHPYAAMDDMNSAVYRLGGWKEVLDNDFNVISIHGTKLDDVNSYSLSSLLEMSTDNGKSEYLSFVKQTADGGYNLIKIPRSSLEVRYVFDAGYDSGGNTGLVITIIFTLMFVLNCVLLSLYLRRKIMRPLGSLQAGINNLKNGHENIKVPIDGPKEFVDIQDSFNETVQHLARTKAEKNAIEESRTNLLLNLSHDIKTPISTIKLYSGALRDGLVSGEKAKDYLQTIDAKATRVSELSDDMFTMLKLENSDYRINLSEHDICELVREICAEHYDDIQSTGLDLILKIPEESIFRQVDRVLFQRLVSNLISNSIKYNKSGKYIFVDICIQSEGVSVMVSDDGNLISLDTAERMFNPFERGDAARTNLAGSGLGLAIANGIAEKHGGCLVYSRNDNKNKFIFTF